MNIGSTLLRTYCLHPFTYDGGINSPGYFTSISDKPLETTQTNESNMSETTGNEVRSVEASAKEPDELETDSKQNESESQQ